MKKLNVLITHVSYQASSGSFIKLLRNSQKYNCYIVGSDTIEKGYSSGSMLVDKFYHIVSKDISDYMDRIKEIIISEKIDLIITAEEADLVLFKSNKISQALYEYIPDIMVFDLFKDKHFATQELATKKIAVPKTIMNQNDFLNSVNKKFIKRKRISCCSRGITVFKRSEITNEYIFYTDEYITQEFIEGELYTVDVFCDKKGVPCSIIPRRALDIKDGTDFKCIIEKQQALIDICKQVYSLYCIPGLSNIQFIIANKPYFIELNPRAAATMIASALSSPNYIDLYISHFLFCKKLPSYNDIMNTVKWGSIISRYYQETTLFPGDI